MEQVSNKNHLEDCRCPEECCPTRLETPKFPSPATCLPEDEQRRLEDKIDAANALLLDLGLSGEQEFEARRKAFEGLIGQIVNIQIDCPEANPKGKDKIAAGRIQLAGQNFVLLTAKEREIVIPYKRICQIKPKEGFTDPPPNEPRLIDIGPCLRRALTFDFGNTVSCSPELINLFFRLSLQVFLLTKVDKKVRILMDNKQVSGMLLEVSGESIQIGLKKRKVREIPIDRICLLLF
jgi:ribosome maturation factor RimP